MKINPQALKAFSKVGQSKPNKVKFAMNSDGKPVPLANGKRNDLPDKKMKDPAQKKALETIRREAADAGSDLASGGEGGLPSDLVLAVMRRDKYTCKTCGQKGNLDKGGNGGLSVHHKGGIPDSVWLSNKGHQNDVNNIVSICQTCHNKQHQEAKAKGVDSSQVTPAGDEGNPRRDKGLPPATP
jgi:hypothetical protein